MSPAQSLPSPPHQPHRPQTHIVIMRLVPLLRHLGHDHDLPVEGRCSAEVHKRDAMVHITDAARGAANSHSRDVWGAYGRQLPGTSPQISRPRSATWAAWALGHACLGSGQGPADDGPGGCGYRDWCPAVPGPLVPEEPACQNTTDQAADVRLPADPCVREQHGELVGEAERHDRPDQHVDQVPVEEPADHDVAEVPEHDAAVTVLVIITSGLAAW